MKEIKREIYLNRLIRRRENGVIKVITGIRRSGKSYLLDPIFRNYLLSEGVRGRSYYQDRTLTENQIAGIITIPMRLINIFVPLSKMNRCTTSFWMKYRWLMILNIS